MWCVINLRSSVCAKFTIFCSLRPTVCALFTIKGSVRYYMCLSFRWDVFSCLDIVVTNWWPYSLRYDNFLTKANSARYYLTQLKTINTSSISILAQLTDISLCGVSYCFLFSRPNTSQYQRMRANCYLNHDSLLYQEDHKQNQN
jgi:hypothetical protein